MNFFQIVLLFGLLLPCALGASLNMTLTSGFNDYIFAGCSTNSLSQGTCAATWSYSNTYATSSFFDLLTTSEPTMIVMRNEKSCGECYYTIFFTFNSANTLTYRSSNLASQLCKLVGGYSLANSQWLCTDKYNELVTTQYRA